MILKANRTLKNSYDQVLFMEGREYHAKMSPKRIYIFNELHTETPFKPGKLIDDFEIVDMYA